MKKPIIGISGSIMIDSSGSFAGYKRSYVNNDYVISVSKNGGVPFIIPFLENIELVKNQLEVVDAIILSGGHDVTPELYGEEPLAKTGVSFPEIDRFDYELIKCAIEMNKPILGICRGMQILNTYFNGKLYQDLSYAKGEILKHDQVRTPSLVTHKIEIEEDSLLYKIFNEKEIKVNSFHHQAVKEVGENLKVTARAKDGIIEAFEHKNYPFLLGVQWHPEMLNKSYEKMNEIFKALINAAAK